MTPLKVQMRKDNLLSFFAPLRLCGNKLSRIMEPQQQVQREKQSYSECHGAENSRHPENSFDCME